MIYRIREQRATSFELYFLHHANPANPENLDSDILYPFLYIPLIRGSKRGFLYSAFFTIRKPLHGPLLSF